MFRSIIELLKDHIPTCRFILVGDIDRGLQDRLDDVLFEALGTLAE
jgi:hypothetical protein